MRVIGLSGVEAFGRVISISAWSTLLESVDLHLLMHKLLAKALGHLPLSRVAVQGERVLSVDLPHLFARLLKVVRNREVAQDGLAGVLAKVGLAGSIASGKLRLYHLLVVRIVDRRVLRRDALVLHAAYDAHRFT